MNKLTDEKIDNILANLASATSLDEGKVNDIASSPRLWWAIQGNIAIQKESAAAPWPPVERFWRWLAYAAVPSIAAILIVASVFVLRQDPEMSGSQPLTKVENEKIESFVVNVESPKTELVAPAVVKKNPVQPKQYLAKRPQSNLSVEPVRSAQRPQIAKKSEEIKSEFIALSYSRSPESGQIVRVRVPSSMMVNPGLVDSVAKPTSLVDAEVVVGDDGQTHAIRFIRQ